MKYYLIGLLVLITSGCANHEIQKYQKIDLTEKTIMVEPGASGLKGKLKQELSNSGWTFAVDRGSIVTEGNTKDQIKLETYNTFKTRYRLYVKSNQYDWCITGSAAIYYDISVVDNTSGSEVFTMNGDGCEKDVVKQFSETINGKVK